MSWRPLLAGLVTLLIGCAPEMPFSAYDLRTAVGGRPAVALNRTRSGEAPQILSVEILPGRGMNIYQVRAWLPGRPDVALLQSPPLDDAARLVDGAFGGAILAPDVLASPFTTQTQVGADYARLSGSLEQLDFDAELRAGGFQFSLTARNTGAEPLPMGIEWRPHFVIPSGDRKQAWVHIAGRRVPLPVDESFAVRMAELSDPAAGYGLRVIGLSPEIDTFRVSAPPDKKFVVLAPRLSVTLKPGESVRYAVKLELVSGPAATRQSTPAPARPTAR